MFYIRFWWSSYQQLNVFPWDFQKAARASLAHAHSSPVNSEKYESKGIKMKSNTCLIKILYHHA